MGLGFQGLGGYGLGFIGFRGLVGYPETPSVMRVPGYPLSYYLVLKRTQRGKGQKGTAREPI